MVSGARSSFMVLFHIFKLELPMATMAFVGGELILSCSSKALMSFSKRRGFGKSFSVTVFVSRLTQTVVTIQTNRNKNRAFLKFFTMQSPLLSGSDLDSELVLLDAISLTCFNTLLVYIDSLRSNKWRGHFESNFPVQSIIS